MKGFWVGRQGTTNTSAIVLSNGEAWFVFQESGVTTGFLQQHTKTIGTKFTGTGNQYPSQSGMAETASTSGVFTEKISLSGETKSGNSSKNFILAYDAQYEKTASLSDAVGSWVGSYGNSTLTMNVVSTGSLSGTSTTGCKYSGTLMPRSADQAVFDVNVTESCGVDASPVVRTLSGIATVNAAKTALSIAATTADKASGALFVGVKQ
jgi:hypothetical protein